MLHPFVQVDAFTAQPFAGNPAAVFIQERFPDDAWMQQVAREMNLSETAFVEPGRDGFALRWFTPKREVELCGHATLASAHVLWEKGHLPPEQPARFHTLSGLLTASRKAEWIEMDFPAEPPEEVPPPPGLIEALSVDAVFVARNRFDYLVEVASEEAVRRLQPDLTRLRQVETRGVMVTSPSASLGFDFVSRYFAPAYGVDEDPVTGSAHCGLGPYWAERLGKKQLVAYQASPRGGVVRVEVAGERVRLAGQAVTVLEGLFLV